ncbi:S8 family serine peptidase [Actinomadura oligospora]|uniref:S8 family serine peptidase n=1 Tax=Actinomadura oligospora TaxID=111804 RepID=UPI001472F49C|nr:S8 family serine peptidase [Actinomadura oligospora]
MRPGVAAGATGLALASILVAVPGAAAQPNAPAQPNAAPSPTHKPTTRPTHKPSTKPSTKPTEQPSRYKAPVKCDNPPVGAPASAITQEPWAQSRLDFEQVWTATKGSGIKVAVVDSGIESANPALRGKVVARFGPDDGSVRDCPGHGTKVAGIIAAKDMRQRNVPFYGVVPDVQLLDAKFTSSESSDNDKNLAQAIKWSVDKGARVINVSVDSPETPWLGQAVRYAQARDVLIVASAGNTENQAKALPAYPANYPGVLSVAAVDAQGTIANFSNIRTRIDVSAPGQGVTSTFGKGYAVGSLDGTSFGAPYAAGVAALVRARHPRLTYQQVINRMEITAEGSIGTGSGFGMINPQQAVMGLVDPNAKPQQKQPKKSLTGAVNIAPVPPTDHRTQNIALGVAGGSIGVALLVAFGGAVIPLGRKRGWRPTKARIPQEVAED